MLQWMQSLVDWRCFCSWSRTRRWHRDWKMAGMLDCFRHRSDDVFGADRTESELGPTRQFRQWWQRRFQRQFRQWWQRRCLRRFHPNLQSHSRYHFQMQSVARLVQRTRLAVTRLAVLAGASSGLMLWRRPGLGL